MQMADSDSVMDGGGNGYVYGGLPSVVFLQQAGQEIERLVSQQIADWKAAYHSRAAARSATRSTTCYLPGWCGRKYGAGFLAVRRLKTSRRRAAKSTSHPHTGVRKLPDAASVGRWMREKSQCVGTAELTGWR